MKKSLIIACCVGVALIVAIVLIGTPIVMQVQPVGGTARLPTDLNNLASALAIAVEDGLATNDDMAAGVLTEEVIARLEYADLFHLTAALRIGRSSHILESYRGEPVRIKRALEAVEVSIGSGAKGLTATARITHEKGDLGKLQNHPAKP